MPELKSPSTLSVLQQRVLEIVCTSGERDLQKASQGNSQGQSNYITEYRIINQAELHNQTEDKTGI